MRRGGCWDVDRQESDSFQSLAALHYLSWNCVCLKNLFKGQTLRSAAIHCRASTQSSPQFYMTTQLLLEDNEELKLIKGKIHPQTQLAISFTRDLSR